MIVKSSFLKKYLISEKKIALTFFALILILLDSSLSYTQNRFSSSVFDGSIPYSLKNKFSWANYQSETYAQFISAWQSIIDNKPIEVDCRFNRLRIYEDLSDDCPSINFLPANDSKQIWEEPSNYNGSIPANTYRSISVNNAPDSLDYDLRYLMIAMGDVDDTSKQLFCLVNGTHGSHESHNLQIAKYFVQVLFDNIEDDWVIEFFRKYTLLIIPCLNVWGNFPLDIYCSSNYGNGNKMQYYDENDNIKEGRPNLLTNMGDLESSEYASLWENVKPLIFSGAEFHSRTHPTTIRPKLSLGLSHPDVVTYLSSLYPNTEPETRALRNIFHRLKIAGYSLRIVLDVHNNGYFRYFTDGWQFGIDVEKDDWINKRDNIYTFNMKEVWGEDNYPPASNPYSEKKLYRLLGTEITPSTNMPADVSLQSGGTLLPNNCLPFAEGPAYVNNYVIINGEKFTIDNTDILPTDSVLTLTGRIGIHSKTHALNSKILSSILDFPLLLGYTGPFFPEYLGKKHNAYLYRVIEIPANLSWLTSNPEMNFTTPLMYSFYLNLLFAHMTEDADVDATVQISSFVVEGYCCNIDLRWETKKEVKSKKFEVERMTPGTQNWIKLGEVIASRNSDSPKSYSFTDKKVNSGKYVYRIKIIFDDETFNYSKEVVIDVEMPKTYAISQNYPNPFNPTTRIDYQLPVDSNVKLELFGITGEKVAVLIDRELSAGYYTEDINAIELNLASGVYICRINATGKNNQNFIKNNKLILTK